MLFGKSTPKLSLNENSIAKMKNLSRFSSSNLACENSPISPQSKLLSTNGKQFKKTDDFVSSHAALLVRSKSNEKQRKLRREGSSLSRHVRVKTLTGASNQTQSSNLQLDERSSLAGKNSRPPKSLGNTSSKHNCKNLATGTAKGNTASGEGSGIGAVSNNSKPSLPGFHRRAAESRS